jgi:hypothetical protein
MLESRVDEGHESQVTYSRNQRSEPLPILGGMRKDILTFGEQIDEGGAGRAFVPWQEVLFVQLVPFLAVLGRLGAGEVGQETGSSIRLVGGAHSERGGESGDVSVGIGRSLLDGRKGDTSGRLLFQVEGSESHTSELDSTVRGTVSTCNGRSSSTQGGDFGDNKMVMYACGESGALELVR